MRVIALNTVLFCRPFGLFCRENEIFRNYGANSERVVRAQLFDGRDADARWPKSLTQFPKSAPGTENLDIEVFGRVLSGDRTAYHCECLAEIFTLHRAPILDEQTLLSGCTASGGCRVRTLPCLAIGEWTCLHEDGVRNAR